MKYLVIYTRKEYKLDKQFSSYKEAYAFFLECNGRAVLYELREVKGLR